MNGIELDFYLSLGCFRMHQDIFTCRYLPKDDQLHTVHWLRIDLDAVVLGPKQNRILRQNAPFRVSVVPMTTITDEHEALYARYRASIDFDAAYSVTQCLLDGATSTVFESYAIEVRDTDTLIAVGVFDQGTDSIAGILNFYHPDYRKYSLGKFLMLQKLLHARAQGRSYYYPGYVVSHYPKFDYKLFACEPATQLYDPDRAIWVPFSWAIVNDAPVLTHSSPQQPF
ncbi:hypothetical protein GCM10027578_24950 [Spirosoma luteolum]